MEQRQIGGEVTDWRGPGRDPRVLRRPVRHWSNGAPMGALAGAGPPRHDHRERHPLTALPGLRAEMPLTALGHRPNSPPSRSHGRRETLLDHAAPPTRRRSRRAPASAPGLARLRRPDHGRPRRVHDPGRPVFPGPQRARREWGGRRAHPLPPRLPPAECGGPSSLRDASRRPGWHHGTRHRPARHPGGHGGASGPPPLTYPLGPLQRGLGARAALTRGAFQEPEPRHVVLGGGTPPEASYVRMRNCLCRVRPSSP